MWYVLPKIRADLARELVKNGMSQKEVAEKLGITPSAVSQYLHKKRGEKIEMSEEYRRIVVKIAEEIRKTTSEEKVSELICQCCMKSRTKSIPSL